MNDPVSPELVKARIVFAAVSRPPVELSAFSEVELTDLAELHDRCLVRGEERVDNAVSSYLRERTLKLEELKAVDGNVAATPAEDE